MTYVSQPNKSVQFCSVVSDSLWPHDCSMPGLSVHYQLLGLTQIQLHWVSDAIQPSHPLLFPFSPAFNLSQHQGLFQWVCSSHQVADEKIREVLELQFMSIKTRGIKSWKSKWRDARRCLRVNEWDYHLEGGPPISHCLTFDLPVEKPICRSGSNS